MDYRTLLMDSIKRMHEEFSNAPVPFTKHGTVMVDGEQRNVFCKCDGVDWDSSAQHTYLSPLLEGCVCGFYPWIFDNKDQEPVFVKGQRVKIVSQFVPQHKISNPPSKAATVGKEGTVTACTWKVNEYLYKVQIDDGKEWTFAAENMRLV